MSGYIIDNTEGNLLADKLAEMLHDAESARFAVGYLYLSGMRKLKGELAHLEKLELVIGAQTDAETQQGLNYALQTNLDMTDDQKREQVKALAENLETQAGTEEPTEELEETVRLLKRMSDEGRLEVRVYTRGRLHAKAYLITEGKHFCAVVGSSNLTASGFSHNRELNVTEYNPDPNEALHAWFDKLWAESEPFTERLTTVLHRSPQLFPVVTPYELYLRLLWEMVGDRLDEEAEKRLRGLEGKIFEELADFQTAALLQGIVNCRKYGGTMIADVVGLGKTYIGVAMLKFFQEYEKKLPLVICPAGLEDMWEEKLNEYGVHGDAVSMGMLGREELPPELSGYAQAAEVVLIDESHNFRNTGTLRYDLLTEHFLADPNAARSPFKKRHVILLTATPYNRHLPDIYHQLKLFLPETELPCGAQGRLTKLADFFPPPVTPPGRDAADEERKKYEEKRKRYEDTVEKAKQLLGHIMIRRQRAHVLNYEKKQYIKGKELTFPEQKLQTIRYDLGASPEHDELYRAVADFIPRDGDSGLTFARYNLAGYLKPGAEVSGEYEGLTKIGGNLQGLMRVNLFKRLESSIFALRETLGRQIRAHEFFLGGLEKGNVLAGEVLSKAIYEDTVDVPEDLYDRYPEMAERYPIAGFELERLKRDIENDLGIFRELQEKAERVDDARDPKLLKLDALIEGALADGSKLLVFSEYADTVDGLYRHFEGRHPEERISRVTSKTKSVADVLIHFSPKANNQPAGEDTIQILFASDVLSEGLNLQDCNRVVNFDLHWNPVRLIQRLGRIDRIGTEHETIYAHNFLTVLGEEAGFNLVEILKRRIEEMRKVVGMTTPVLTEQDKLDEEGIKAIYGEEEIERLRSDALGLSLPSLEAEGTLRRLRAENPGLYERIANLPLGVRSFKRADERRGILACVRRGKEQGFSLVGEDEVKTLSEQEVIDLAKCGEKEPPAQEPKDLLVSIRRAIADYRMQNRATGSPALSKHYIGVRKRLLDELRNLGRLGPEKKAVCSEVADLLINELRENVLHDADKQATPVEKLAYLRRVYAEAPPPRLEAGYETEYFEDPSGTGPKVAQLTNRCHVRSLLGLI